LNPGIPDHLRQSAEGFLKLEIKIIYDIFDISDHMRIAKSFTIDPEISEYVADTRGDRSASERVNDLLRRAMQQERYDRLEEEAKAFFSSAGVKERQETRAFQKAAVRAFERD
jgi:hypothetical protein